MNRAARFIQFIDTTFIDLGRQFRLSFLPPLMVYAALGISGLTNIVGVFFLKDYLHLSASFLAGLGFWATLLWTLKLPLGHLMDLLWQHKNKPIYLGAAIIAVSLLIMYALIMHTAAMQAWLSLETWFIISTLLAPVGFVLQDVVADAMTAEAVPTQDEYAKPYSTEQIKAMHTTLQALGRFAFIGGGVLVALVNVIFLRDVDTLAMADKIKLYGDIYLYALSVPLVSVAGVWLAKYLKVQQQSSANKQNPPVVNSWIVGGSLLFVVFTLVTGVMDVVFAQEIVFIGSIIIIGFLIGKLRQEIPQHMQQMIIGTAIIIFIFRAVPSAGSGYSWFAIDELGFNEQFFAVLSLLASILTLVGIVLLRPLIMRHSIAWVVVILSIAEALLLLPNIGLYYGIHHWTAALSDGVIDAKFIALMDTALESPLGQISMIPLLAWIAKNAPSHLKATFFAVFTSFSNLAISAGMLGTKYLNEVFTVTRQVRDKVTGVIESSADYSELGLLLVSALCITLCLTLVVVLVVQRTRFKRRRRRGILTR